MKELDIRSVNQIKSDVDMEFNGLVLLLGSDAVPLFFNHFVDEHVAMFSSQRLIGEHHFLDISTNELFQTEDGKWPEIGVRKPYEHITHYQVLEKVEQLAQIYMQMPEIRSSLSW